MTRAARRTETKTKSLRSVRCGWGLRWMTVGLRECVAAASQLLGVLLSTPDLRARRFLQASRDCH